MTIATRLLILDALVVSATFICTSKFLEKIHKYGEKKEMKHFPLIQLIGTSLGEDEPSEKDFNWWSFTLKHIFIVDFNQGKTKTFYFGSKKALASMISKDIRTTCNCNISVSSMVSLSSFFWNIYLANQENNCLTIYAIWKTSSSLWYLKRSCLIAICGNTKIYKRNGAI